METVFYHAPCIDGLTSAWVYRQSPENVNKHLYFQPYNHVNPSLEGRVRDRAVFLDCAPISGELGRLLSTGYAVRVIDHHATPVRQLQPFDGAPGFDMVYDRMRAGSGLVWDTLNPQKKRPYLVDLVNAIDLMQPSFMERTDDFFAVANMLDTLPKLGREIGFSQLDLISALTPDQVLDMAQSYQKEYDSKIQDVSRRLECRPLHHGGVNLNLYVAEADIHTLGRQGAHRLAQDLPNQGSIVLLFKREVHGGKEVVRGNLRTADPKIDLSQIAETLALQHQGRGGGREGAAAVWLPDVPETWVG